jgi:hypothetical protein
MRAGGVPRLRVNLYQGIVEYLQQYFLLPGRPNALSGKHSPSTKSSIYVVPAERGSFLRYLGRRDARAGAQALMVSDERKTIRRHVIVAGLSPATRCLFNARVRWPSFSLEPQYLDPATI